MTAKRVLIVDDDADWREFVRINLEDLGYEALEAASGEEALAAVAEDPPAVVLLDLNMPGMGGAEVAARLPRGRTQVVVVTSAPVQDAVGALGTGAHYYLPKGASREQLAMILQSLSLR